MKLAGRRALVTGGGGGLGELIVRALAAQQMRLVIADVDGEAADRVAAEVDGSAVTADLSAVEGVHSVVAAVGQDIDVLINNAGGWRPTERSYPDASEEEWDAVLTLNLRSPMRLLQRLRTPARPSRRRCRSHPAQLAPRALMARRSTPPPRSV